MFARFRASPGFFIALACVGSVFAVCGLAFEGAHRLPLFAIVACTALALAGACLVYWAPYQLRDGVQNERWPARQVDQLRNVVEHPAYLAATLLLFAVMISCLLVGAHRHRGVFWVLFLLLQATSQISNALRRPLARPGTPARLDWSKVPPLHSKHWGER